jgi:exonuclease SbcC
MRITNLTLTGIGPFAGKEQIDFSVLSRDGMFLIRGETGSGKSSILNAITYALYGTVKDGNTRIVSDHKPAEAAPFVSCEFVVGETLYRVDRTPEWQRPKRRGGGTTTERTSGALFRRAGEEWVEISTRQQEIGGEISRIIGLTREQFTQVMMLQQGRFAAFLHAKDSDRQQILGTIFGVDPYRRIEEELKVRADEARREAAQGEATMKAHIERLEAECARTVEFDSDADIAALADMSSEETRSQFARMAHDVAKHWEAEAERAVLRAQSAAAAVRMATTRAGQLKRLISVADLVTRLEESREPAHAAELRLSAHERSVAPLAAQAAADHASVRAAAAAEELTQRRASLDERAAAAPGWLADSASAAGLEVTHETLVNTTLDRIAEWEGLSQTVPELEIASIAASDAAARARTAAHTSEQELEAAREKLAGMRAEAEQAAANLVPLQDLDRAMERAAELLARIERRDALDLSVQSAEAAVNAARADEAEATLTLGRLRTAYAEQVAPRLALVLEEGTACIVCGSLDHPEPARPTSASTLITEEDVDAAEHAMRLASTGLSEAQRSLITANAEREALGEFPDDATADQARGSLAEATAARGAGAAAHDSAASLAAAAEDFGQAMESLRSRLHEAQLAAATAAALADERSAEAVKGRRRLDEATALLGGPDQAGDARVFVEQLRTDLRAVATADDRQNQAARAAAESADHVASLLSESGFSSGEEAAAAHLDDETVRAHRDCLRDRDKDCHTLRGLSEEIRRDQTHLAAAGHALSGITSRVLETARAALAGSTTDPAGFRLDALSMLHGLARALTPLQRAHAAASAIASAHQRKAALATDWARRVADESSLLRTLDEDLGDAVRRSAMLTSLSDNAVGNGSDNTKRMSLQIFVLAEKLIEIAEHASRQLLSMSDGRYEILHDDGRVGNQKSGLGLKILDNWTNEFRHPTTLSGGETFMASMSLALGLADVVRNKAGGISLDMLFVDEGFGTLDTDALQKMMQVLDDLQQSGRAVGIVSHVSELHERIACQVQIDKQPTGSRLRVVTA